MAGPTTTTIPDYITEPDIINPSGVPYYSEQLGYWVYPESFGDPSGDFIWKHGAAELDFTFGPGPDFIWGPGGETYVDPSSPSYHTGTSKRLSTAELYEAYMDIGKYGEGGEYGSRPFAEDVYAFFSGTKYQPEFSKAWAEDWGKYLPAYDPTEVDLARRTKNIDYQKAESLLNLSSDITNRVYSTSAGDISTQVGAELKKAKKLAGGLGLRSGALETAVEGAITSSGDKVKDLADRFMLQKEEDINKHNISLVDSALDFDKAEAQSKKDFYDRTLAAVGKIAGLKGFDEMDCENMGMGVTCAAGGCAADYDDCPTDACGTPNGSVYDPLDCTGVPSGSVVGNTITGECEYGDCNFSEGCTQVCYSAGADAFQGGMMQCGEDCTGAMAGGAGSWGAGDWVIKITQGPPEEGCIWTGGSWDCSMTPSAQSCSYPCVYDSTYGCIKDMWDTSPC